MKRLFRLLLVLITAMMFVGFGCQPDSSLPNNGDVPNDSAYPSYTLTFSSTLRDLAALDYREIVLEELDSTVGEHVPVPTYFPEAFEIQEVYIAESPKGSRWVIPILISDEPIQWQDKEFSTKILYTLYWVSVEPKRPDLDRVSISQGRGWAYIKENDDHLTLIWYWRGSLYELAGTRQFSVEELAKIAGAVQ